MSLTVGTGPFGHAPLGRFNFEVPRTDVMFVEPSPRWIRGERGGDVVVDSRRAMMLHEHGRLSRYFVPREDVRWEALVGVEVVEPPADAPGLEGHVSFPFDVMDAWFEEDERIVAHAPDPYHRIDVRPTSRHLRLSSDGVELADSRRARALFESNLPTRWYLPREDVSAELVPSDLRTTCAYKGVASYFHVRAGERLLENLVWTYPQPRHDAEQVRDLVCFFNEAVDLDVDGEREQRPVTPWARPGWWRAYEEVR